MRLAAVALAVALAGCGVPAQDAPSRLDPSVAPTHGVARPVVATVYFVRGSRLVAERRLVVSPGTAAQRLAALANGPGEGTDLATAVDGDVSVEVRAGIASVALPPAYARRDRGERLLAAAQIVLTLTETADVAVVRFTVGGLPASMPTPEGPDPGPFTRADYASLL